MLEQAVARAGAEASTKFATAHTDNLQEIRSMTEAIDRLCRLLIETEASAATATRLGQGTRGLIDVSVARLLRLARGFEAEASRFAVGTQGVGRELQQLTIQVTELQRAISNIGL